MAIRIHCPNCQAGLSMPETMYNKSVRCPSCKTAFVCPPGPEGGGGQAPGAPAAPAWAAPPAPPPPPAARPVPAAGNPFAMQPPPAAIPAAQPAFGGFDEPRAYAPRRSGGWTRVQSGLLFVAIGAMCLGLMTLVELIFVPKHSYRGNREGVTLRPKLSQSEIQEIIKEGPKAEPRPIFQWHGMVRAALYTAGTAKFLSIINLLLYLGALTLLILGCAFCCGAPSARGFILGAMIAMLVAAVAGAVFDVLQLVRVFGEPKDIKVGERGLWAALKIFEQTAFVAAIFLFTLFLGFAATSTQQRGNAVSIWLFLILTISLTFFTSRGEFFFNSLGLAERDRSSGSDESSDNPPIWFYVDYVFKLGLLTWFIVIAFVTRSGIASARAR